jgi:plastocyanin
VTAFQQVSVGAAAFKSSGGNPLALVAVDLSRDNGVTWTRIVANSRPRNPTDLESSPTVFTTAGMAVVRATAMDTHGLTASSQVSLVVGKATQPAPTISPSSATVTAGQTVPFAASGGATGNYSWGGSASSTGPAASALFTTSGTFAVTLVDEGNANYLPSPAASSTVTVGPALYTLSLMASAGGTVTGGGSYPANASATAVALPATGNAFAGWTGDVVSSAPTVTVTMTANKSLLASFTALLAQTLSATAPSGISTRSPAFTVAAQASSGLPVTLTLDSGPATLNASVLTPGSSPGVVTLTATQPGNSEYLPAAPLVISFPIGLPPAGVLYAEDSAATKRSDRMTRNTSYTSGPTR